MRLRCEQVGELLLRVFCSSSPFIVRPCAVAPQRSQVPHCTKQTAKCATTLTCALAGALGENEQLVLSDFQRGAAADDDDDGGDAEAPGGFESVVSSVERFGRNIASRLFD